MAHYSQSNVEYIRENLVIESMLPKAGLAGRDKHVAKMRFLLGCYKKLRGIDLSGEKTILDFGCAYGALVEVLRSHGFDAYGVDILEYWGKDELLCGEEVVMFPDEIRRRLHVLDPASSSLPFDDSFFDVIFSDQVLEHVFELEAAFKQQHRVLKRGGMAIHRFPKRHAAFEAHTQVPIASLNRFRWYLMIWALLGKRNGRQAGLSWRETVHSNRALYGTTHYVAKGAMLEVARKCGFNAYFIEPLSVMDSRVRRVYDKLRRYGIAGAFKPLLSMLSVTHILVLEARDF